MTHKELLDPPAPREEDPEKLVELGDSNRVEAGLADEPTEIILLGAPEIDQELTDIDEQIEPPGEDPNPERSLAAQATKRAAAAKKSSAKDKRPKPRNRRERDARDMAEGDKHRPKD